GEDCRSWRRKDCSRQKKCFEGKKSPTEISWSVRRNLGRSWRKTSLACCCDQRWKEARRFPDRQVSTKGTVKAQVEALTFACSEVLNALQSFFGRYTWAERCFGSPGHKSNRMVVAAILIMLGITAERIH